jgi:hypothetical protein
MPKISKKNAANYRILLFNTCNKLPNVFTFDVVYFRLLIYNFRN